MRPKRGSLFKSFLVEPFLQIRFGLHVVAVSLFYVVLLGAIFGRAVYEQYMQVMEIFQVVDSEAKWELVVNQVFMRNAILFFGALGTMIITMLAVVIYRTHKMYGPMIGVTRFVGELKKGNFDTRMSVRRSDDFQNVVKELNELAQMLHKNYGAKKGTESRSDLDALGKRVSAYEQGRLVSIITPTGDDASVEDTAGWDDQNKAS